MTVTKQEKEFVDHIVDFTQSIGRVASRRMFGGYGLFLNGLMFGLVADSTLYLKTDKELEPEFAAKGLAPFTYSRKGKVFKMSYYQAPEETLEDTNEMTTWASKAYNAAVRSAAKNPKQKK